VKKTLEMVNPLIVGHLVQEGTKLWWCVDSKKIKSFSFPSKHAMWWFLKGVMLMDNICPLYRQEMNRRTGRAPR